MQKKLISIDKKNATVGYAKTEISEQTIFLTF